MVQYEEKNILIEKYKINCIKYEVVRLFGNGLLAGAGEVRISRGAHISSGHPQLIFGLITREPAVVAFLASPWPFSGSPP